MNNITCGNCARKQKLSLEDRKQLSLKLKEGQNICNCGRILELYNRRLKVIKEGRL
jgi:hypothetical protein